MSLAVVFTSLAVALLPTAPAVGGRLCVRLATGGGGGWDGGLGVPGTGIGNGDCAEYICFAQVTAGQYSYPDPCQGIRINPTEGEVYVRAVFTPQTSVRQFRLVVDVEDTTYAPLTGYPEPKASCVWTTTYYVGAQAFLSSCVRTGGDGIWHFPNTRIYVEPGIGPTTGQAPVDNAPISGLLTVYYGDKIAGVVP